ncbi:MAG: conjugal transfer transcriptional regulator TraJ [Nitrosospira sp.]|nr:conjugal transfer transcriptional regulator TraJ [Nitrosospira sp.]
MDKDQAQGARITRKQHHLRVPVLPEEATVIKAQAQSAGLPVAAYLRNVGLGMEVKSVLDYERIEDLARINGDLGRLGGLLKLWLTNDERLRGIRVDELRAVLIKIERNQDAMRAIMQTVLAR